MRRYNLLFILLFLVAIAPVASANSGRVIKVLPEFLDKAGRNSLSPSLYERDAYQKTLRTDHQKRSSLGFFVQWKAKGVDTTKLKMRVEMRGVHQNTVNYHTIEEPAVRKSRWFSTWSVIKFEGKPYKDFGELIAWRVSLWEGDKLLSEQKSFMWQ